MRTLGIDIGTTSICMVVYDLGKKEVIETKSIDNEFIKGDENYEQNPDQIVEKIKLLMECFDLNSIQGIGISSQMHGILYVNKEGKAVSNFYTWKDERANKKINETDTYAAYLQKNTGYGIYSGYGTATHFYLQTNNKIPKEAVKFVNIGDYVSMRLTNRVNPIADPTIAASFGGYSLKENAFDFNMLEKCEIDCRYYPEVMKSGLKVGNYRGIPVLNACGDNQASFLGAVSKKESSISINVGTGSQVSIYESKRIETKNVEIRPFPDGGYLYVGASLNGGKAYECLAEFFKEVCTLFTGQEIEPYKIMAEIGGNARETSLITIPAIYGSRGNEENQSGIFQLTSQNFHAADLIRSYVHGMAEELLQIYLGFPEEVRSAKEVIIASGNGIRKNHLLQEEITKVFQMPILFTENEEEAATGAAMLWKMQA